MINFSSIRFLYDLIVLVNWMLYTWGKSATHSPILHILGLKLKHSGDTSSPGISLTKIIEISAFFIQFLEWWFTNQSSQAKSMLSLPIPPPPHSIAQSQYSKTRVGACPICQQQWKNECVLRVSGYLLFVFFSLYLCSLVYDPFSTVDTYTATAVFCLTWRIMENVRFLSYLQHQTTWYGYLLMQNEHTA